MDHTWLTLLMSNELINEIKCVINSGMMIRFEVIYELSWLSSCFGYCLLSVLISDLSFYAVLSKFIWTLHENNPKFMCKNDILSSRAQQQHIVYWSTLYKKKLFRQNNGFKIIGTLTINVLWRLLWWEKSPMQCTHKFEKKKKKKLFAHTNMQILYASSVY